MMIIDAELPPEEPSPEERAGCLFFLLPLLSGLGIINEVKYRKKVNKFLIRTGLRWYIKEEGKDKQ